MLNRFKYKDWNFVEYINPKLEDSWSPDNVYQSGTYDGIYKSKSNDDEARVFERIMDWFKHIESDEETVFDSDEVWDSLAERERVKWFKGSRHMFISWWDKLPSKLKYYYTDRLISNKPLLPDRALFNETPKYSLESNKKDWKTLDNYGNKWHKKNYKARHTSRCFDVEYSYNNVTNS